MKSAPSSRTHTVYLFRRTSRKGGKSTPEIRLQHQRRAHGHTHATCSTPAHTRNMPAEKRVSSKETVKL
eukprot:COSAG02_NODE_8306_length_2623_cov_6.816165_1_plen_69_part_00